MESILTKPQDNPDTLHNKIRDDLMSYSKDFKTSWINLGQALYSVYRDKLYYGWGFEKFEYYTQQELGLKKQVAFKMLRSYCFLETEEPEILKKEYNEHSDASLIPTVDTVNVLRLAKNNKELKQSDYMKLKKQAFEKGKDAALIRKDLTALIKERKPVDPEEERRNRNESSIRKLVVAIDTFSKDMEALKLVPKEIIEEANQLMAKLEKTLRDE